MAARLICGALLALFGAVAAPAAAPAQVSDPGYGQDGYYWAPDEHQIAALELIQTGPHAGQPMVLMRKRINGSGITDWILTRLTTTGEVDTDFATEGLHRFSAVGATIAVTPAGSTLLLRDDKLSRLDNSGSPNEAFGDAGMVDLLAPVTPPKDPCTQRFCMKVGTGSLRLRPDGRILVLGSYYTTYPQSMGWHTYPVLTQWMPNGELDLGFNDDGVWNGLEERWSTWRTGLADWTLLPAGEIALLRQYGSTCASCTPEWDLTLHNADGEPLQSWRAGRSPYLRSRPRALAVGPSGDLIAGGAIAQESPTWRTGLWSAPFEAPDSLRLFAGPEINDLVALPDGSIGALGTSKTAEYRHVASVARIDDNLTPGTTVTEQAPGSEETELRIGTAGAGRLLAAGNAYEEAGHGPPKGFVIQVDVPPGPETPPPPDPPPPDPPEEGPPDTELGMQVHDERVPTRVGPLVRRGASAIVSCRRDCVVELRLVAEGRRARRLGLSGVIAKGSRELWGHEPNTVDAFLRRGPFNKLSALNSKRTTVRVKPRFRARPLVR